MKRILSIILTMAIIFSAIGGLVINPQTAYARKGVDVNGNPVANYNVYQPTDDPVYYYQPPVDENGNHDYFGYPIFGDPMDITDEEFFGKWDDLKQEWVLTPYFAYHNYPEMSKIEEAAKKGDYETAKVELKNYYSNYTGRVVPVYSADAKAATNLEAISRNIYAYDTGTGVTLGGFELPAEEWGRVEIDILNEFKNVGNYSDFNVMIASGDKFWTTGQIYSKDASDPDLRPVLRITVNGVVTERYPNRDAMVVGGSGSGTNYGFDEIMEFQEHGYYDDIGEPKGNYDENTKRGFINFDVSDLKANDSITSAKLVLTGRSVITDETRLNFSDENGTPYSKPAKPKYMWASWYRASEWTEADLTWGSDVIGDKHYFSCNDVNAWDFVTAKNPGQKGKVCIFLRYNMQGLYPDAYLVYGNDERYAYNCIRQDMAMMNSLGDEPDVMNQLDNAVCMINIAATPFYLMDSKYMTPEIFTAYLKFVWILANTTEQKYFGVRDNNWATYSTSGVYTVVSYYPELLIHDYWYQRVLEEHDRCLSGFTFEDGHCVEMSQAYISTILSTFRGPMNVYNSSGHASPYSEELYQVIYDIVKNGIYTQGGPYGGGFNIADSTDPKTNRTTMYKQWYQLLFSDDEEIAYMATNGALGRLPENPTTHYPVALRTFMRSSWDGKTALQMSFINTSDSRKSHEHYDCLSVAMYAYGSYLLVDPGYGSDQTGDGGRVWDYNRSPIQHNLVTVNDTYDYLTDGVVGYTQLAADSTWEKDFETNKSYDFIEYVCDGYSTAQTMQRSVTFLKDQKFWIISDYAVPKNPDVENVFAQHWHLYPGAEPIHDANYAVRSNFDGPNVLIVPIEYEEIDDLQYVNGYYAEASGQKILHPKAMITKSQTGAGRFTTLIIPVDIVEDFEVISTVLENNNDIDDKLLNMTNFKITEKSTGNTSYYCYYHINDASKKPADGVKVSNYVTDATTMLLQFNENMNLVSVFATEASYIHDTAIGEYILEADEETTISFTKSGKFLNINSSLYDEAQDLVNLSLYMPNVSAVRIGDKNVSTNILDGVITFDGTYGGGISTGGGSGGGGGGGSSGGGAVKPPVDDKENEEDNKEDNNDENVENKPVVTPVTPSYSDVKENDWYFDSVEELTEKGIVSGDGTGNFNPTANVTREQFLKMIIEASGLETDEAENTFDDVKDAWYTPYVLKAKNFGIVNGVSDTRFGIGTNITRQDMAVMIARTIEKMNLEVEKLDVGTFADDEKVSDYASEAVSFMKSIGLIEGYNNEFRPLDNLTRAEAATIITKFIKEFKI